MPSSLPVSQYQRRWLALRFCDDKQLYLPSFGPPDTSATSRLQIRMLRHRQTRIQRSQSVGNPLGRRLDRALAVTQGKARRNIALSALVDLAAIDHGFPRMTSHLVILQPGVQIRILRDRQTRIERLDSNSGDSQGHELVEGVDTLG